MKKFFSMVTVLLILLLAAQRSEAQGLKVGVFDIDVMVQAMPGYHNVDSLVRIFEKDSLGAEYDIYQSEYALSLIHI